MFEYYGNKLCVHASWLYNEVGIISKSNYDKLRQRKIINIANNVRGGNGRMVLIEYDSIPTRFQQKIINTVGDPYKITNRSRFKDLIEQDTKALEYYNNYTLDNGTGLPNKNIKQYVANASILNTVTFFLNRYKNSSKSQGKKSITKLWKNLSEVINNLPLHTYPHKLPKNPRKLKQKYKAYITNGYESLIHKGFCNDNSEKINDEAKIWVLSRWADRVKRVTGLDQLLFEYNQKADQKGWQKLKDENTLRLYLNKDGVKHLWYGHRYGDSASKEKFAYQHSTKLPTMRDSLWYADGTKLNLFYLDKNGKVATCQVYEVMDAYSEVFLGFHVSKTEDYEAQYMAFKMAVKTSGYKPYQISFDGQGGHKKLKAGEFFNKITRLPIKTAPYNGKSKTIESAFGRFQQRYLKQHWCFTGQNITAKKAESKAQREFINANLKELPDLKGAIKLYIESRQQWNSAPHPKTGIPRLEMYYNSVNPQTRKVELWDMVDLFWIERPKQVTCTPYGISFTEKKVKYTYMVYTNEQMPDVKWLRDNVDQKFTVKFDPEDMSMIYLYKKDALGLRFVTEARTKIEIHRGKQEQEQWEAEFIANIKAQNELARIEADKQMDEMLESNQMLPEQYGLKSPGLLGLKNNSIGKVQKQESNIVTLTDDEDFNLYDMI